MEDKANGEQREALEKEAYELLMQLDPDKRYAILQMFSSDGKIT